MSRLQELLVRWQDDALNEGEYEELVARLEDPEARSALADDFLDTGSIREALSELNAEQTVDEAGKEDAKADSKRKRKSSTRLARVSRLRVVRSPVGIVAAATAGLAAAAAILIALASGTPQAPKRRKPRVAVRRPTSAAEWMPEVFRDQRAERAAEKPEPAVVDDREPDAVALPTAPAVDMGEPGAIPTFTEPTEVAVEPPAAPPAPKILVAYVDTLQGDVEISDRGSQEWKRAWSGAPVSSGDRIRTKYARARVAFESGSILLMNRFTTLTVDRVDETPRLDMVGGEVFVSIKGAQDRGFCVHTPHGTAIDLGTRFGVEAKRNATVVVVAEGSVKAVTEKGDAELQKNQEVSLLARSLPPSRVRAARNLERRLAWTKPFTRVPPLVVPPPADGTPAVVSFTLIDAENDRPIPGFDPMPNNVTIDLAVLPTRNITIVANTIPVNIGSVRFNAPGLVNKRGVENVVPFALSGDTNENYNPLDVKPGTYTVTATPYKKKGAQGEPGRELSITFTIVDAASGK